MATDAAQTILPHIVGVHGRAFRHRVEQWIDCVTQSQEIHDQKTNLRPESTGRTKRYCRVSLPLPLLLPKRWENPAEP